jgi:hypothetical protein
MCGSFIKPNGIVLITQDMKVHVLACQSNSIWTAACWVQWTKALLSKTSDFRACMDLVSDSISANGGTSPGPLHLLPSLFGTVTESVHVEVSALETGSRLTRDRPPLNWSSRRFGRLRQGHASRTMLSPNVLLDLS